MKYRVLAEIGDWTFFEVRNHGFESVGDRPLYAYELVADPGEPGKPKFEELHSSLDRAIISAVGEKYTARRGASGTGVGTAADWFARMIGMDELTPIGYDEGQKALQNILADTAKYNGPVYKRAQKMNTWLERHGLTLAVKNTP